MKVLITAGGTGGHIMPAVAIAEAIRKRKPESKILFVGTDRGMEERIARLKALDFIPIRALGIKGKSLITLIQAVMVNLKAFFTALKIIKDFRPDWVIGTGGYITGMVVLAGRLMGSKVAIQEQNSVPGLTNRILSKIAHRVFLAFPDNRGRFKAAKTLLTGNPLRDELTAFHRDKAGKYLLILGGSLGAASINRAAVGAARILKDEGHVLKIVHQTGKPDYSWVSQAYAQMGMDVRVYDFIDDMAPIYQGALLAVSRCGGITLSELSAAGLPSIMIPFPHAADDHQTENARYVATLGGGWIIQDAYLTPERMSLEIKARLFNQECLRQASINMQRTGLGAGAESIAKEIIGV